MAKNNEAKIKFTADTKEFNDSIKSANSSLQELRSELRLNDAQISASGETTELLKERQDILAKQLEVSKDKTVALNEKLEAAKRIYGEDSEEVKKLETQLNNARTAEVNIERQISETNKKLDAQKNSFDGIAKKAEAVGGKLQDVGKKMSVVSAGIGAVAGASVAAFNEVDDGADNVVRATGAVGEQAQELAEAYENVASQVVGSFDDIGSAVGEVNTRFGYVGQDLEDASLLFEKFADITGTDAKEAVQSVSRALNDAGIPLDEYGSLLDQLAKAGQVAGIDVSRLSESLSENGSIMRTMGFTTEETIALLSNFELSGANTSVMLTGMKRAMATFAEEGKNGNEEFAKMVEGIANGSITAGEAIDVFGTKAGPMLVEAIQSGKFEYQDMLAVIQNSKGTVESTFDETIDGGYEMQLAMQNAKIALAEVGETLVGSLAPIIENVTSHLREFASWWENLDPKMQTTIITIAGIVAAIGPALIIIGKVISSVQQIINVIKMVKTAFTALSAVLAANPIGIIIIAITALVAAFIYLWNNCEAFRNFWINLWNNIKTIFTTVVEAIKNGLSEAWEFIKNVTSTVFNAIKAVVTVVWNAIKLSIVTPIQTALTVIQTVVNGIKNFLSFGGLKSTVSSVWNGIKNAVLNPIETAKNKIKGIVDTIKGFFSGMKLSLPKIKLPHFKITGKLSLSPPSVPKLSIDWYKDGGIMMKPTIFGVNGTSLMAGGEAGPEAILPISKLEGYIENAIDKSMQALDLHSLAAAIESLANRPFQMNINGQKVATATAGDYDTVNGTRYFLKERGVAQ